VTKKVVRNPHDPLCWIFHTISTPELKSMFVAVCISIARFRQY